MNYSFYPIPIPSAVVKANKAKLKLWILYRALLKALFSAIQIVNGQLIVFYLSILFV